MAVGALLGKAWAYSWGRRYMVVLGVLIAALSVWTTRAFTSFGVAMPQGGGLFVLIPREETTPESAPLTPEVGPGAATAVIVTVVVGLAFVGVVLLGLHFASRMAQGALIGCVNRLETVGTSSFEEGIRAAWQRAGPLFGLGLLSNAPLILLFIVATAQLGGIVFLLAPGDTLRAQPEIAQSLTTPLYIAVGLSAALRLPRHFLDRALISGDGAAVGLRVMGRHLPVALGVFIVTFGLRILLGGALYVAGALAALCVLLWPAMIFIGGLADAFTSVLWTLLWRQWTAAA